MLSDVHLGSDLGAHARRSQSVDADLVRLIEHYRRAKPHGERWRLVVAGDFVDFIGMVIPASASDPDLLATALDAEEMQHGLGNAGDHARIKMRAVGARHAEVFAALAEFVVDGHTLTLVHGNHDVEFFWEVVQDEFKRTLLAHARPHLTAPGDEESFLGRIEFNPWFFYVDGVAYIEHGHQYDPLCATDHVMAPLSPLDPRRIMRGFSDVLLRFVVRPTRGLKEYGHERLGIVDYVRFGLELGVMGALRLGGRFFSAVLELFRLRRAYLTEAMTALREEHERRIALLAEARRIGLDRLKALVALQSPPITRSMRGILASVLLDRLALGMVAIFAVAVLAAIGLHHGHAFWGCAGIVVAWALLHRHLTRSRPKIDAGESLIERASKLAKLFPAAFVVMGHTHVPVKVPVNEGRATYINLGSWAEDEETVGAEVVVTYQAARTHLVIHPSETEAGPPVAEFLAWDSRSSAPRLFAAEAPASASASAPAPAASDEA